MSMKYFKHKKNIVISGILILILSFGFVRSYDKDFELVKSLDIFYSLFRELNLFYVDETNPEKLIETGIKSMLSSLDPYTTYIDESEMDDFNFMTTGNYGGIGSLIRASESYTMIADPYEGFPAQKAGLRAGDYIISVDGFNTKGKSLSTVSEKLKGVPDTELILEVRKAGKDKIEKIKLKRQQIHISNVSYSGMLDSKTGYIRLSNFTLGAGQETQEALINLRDNQGAEKIILDLRGNPGGLLLEAVRVANIFIDKGQLIVSTKGKIKQWDQDYYTTNNPTDTKIPLMVLVNRGSASASEIVAGAIQDLDRGVIIGLRTFGKGLVQSTRKLKYNAQLKVTTAKYYIPSGRCIQALDYTNRNEDGSVGHIPDSLISEFETKGGRKVYDGGGIKPDIVDSMDNLSIIAINLYIQNVIFDFATNYMVANTLLPDPDNWTIDHELYEDFKKFVASRDFIYETSSEDALMKLISTAKTEKYYEFAEGEFDALQRKLAYNNQKDLDVFHDEISSLIKEEILSRYYFQKGRIKASIESDSQISTAIKFFEDPAKYSTVLSASN